MLPFNAAAPLFFKIIVADPAARFTCWIVISASLEPSLQHVSNKQDVVLIMLLVSVKVIVDPDPVV